MIAFLISAILLLLLASLAVHMWPITIALLGVGAWLVISYAVVLLAWAVGLSTAWGYILGVGVLFAPVWYFTKENQ